MKYAFLFAAMGLGTLAIGCGYEDPRPDPRSHPDYVDTSDASVVLGQRKAEVEEAQKKGKK